MRSRILLADDHPLVLEGLRRILDRPEFEIVDMVRDGRALVAAAHKLKPDAIVADISMPLLSGVEAARQIRKHDPNVKIIFLTMHLRKIYAVEAIIAGGSGYVLKTAVGEELIAAIQEVMNGKIYVTGSLAEPVMKALRARRESSDRAGG
jgi:DNA-binding NarL/FixJ family response regulator